MKKRALVILASGFEELEALSPIDVLRRASVEVVVASVSSKEVKGAHSVSIVSDKLISEVLNESFDAIILPGGMPGAVNLYSSNYVKEILLKANKEKALICAICASPAYVLAPLGLLKDKRATCYPGCEENCPEVTFSSERVIKDSNIITAIGPGAALEFSLEIVKALLGDDKVNIVASGMLVL